MELIFSCGIVDVDMRVSQAVLRCDSGSQRLNTIALGGVMSTGQKGNATLARVMCLGLGNFTGDKGLDARRDGLLKISLATTRTPRHPLNRHPLRQSINQNDWALQTLLHMLCKLRSLRKSIALWPPKKQQILFAQLAFDREPQQTRQLRVVAEFRMCIQRQMVGEKVDIVLQQKCQTLLHPAGNASILPAPEQAVVHHDGVSPLLNGRLDERTAGSDSGNQRPDFLTPFYLEPIGTVIFEVVWPHMRIKRIQQIMPQHMLLPGKYGPWPLQNGNFSDNSLHEEIVVVILAGCDYCAGLLVCRRHPPA